MPVKSCTRDGEKGWKWGDEGHCYVPGDDADDDADAKRLAYQQGLAAGEVDKAARVVLRATQHAAGLHLVKAAGAEALLVWELPNDLAERLALDASEGVTPVPREEVALYLGSVTVSDDLADQLAAVAADLSPADADLVGVARLVGAEDDALVVLVAGDKLEELRRDLEREVGAFIGFQPYIPIAVVSRDVASPVDGLSQLSTVTVRTLTATGVGEWALEDELETEKVLRDVTILKADDELRVSVGVLYKPNAVDAHGEFVAPEDLERAVYEFMRAGDLRLRLQHDMDKEAGDIVGMFVLPWEWEIELTVPGKEARQVTLPEGTVLTAAMWDEEVWDDVKSGKIAGFSLGGRAVRVRNAGDPEA